MSKFRVVLNAWLLALILFCVVAVPIFAAYSDCAYYLTVTVSNNSSTSYPNLRVVYTVNPASLVAGGYMQVDADDIYLTSSSSVLYSTALNMTGDGVHWLGVVNAPAHSNQQLRLYTGWVAAAGRNQTWCASSGDVGTVADSASLDITTNLTVEALVNSTNTTGTSDVFCKANAYGLKIEGGRYYFGALSGITTTTTLRPIGVGNVTDVGVVSGSGTHWGAVDEVVSDDDTTYIEEQTTTRKYDGYELGNATGVDTRGVISSVTVYYNVRESGAGSTEAGPWVVLNGVAVYGTFADIGSATFTLKSEVLARPGGGSWTWNDIDNLYVGVSLKGVDATHAARCTQVYAVVTYYPYREVSIPATTSTWTTLKGSYNGTAVGLYSDGVLGNSTAMTGSIYNGGVATCLQFDGLIDLLRIGSTNMETPTWVANYLFEATQANSGQIIDQSGNGNTITYTLASMPSGTGTVVGSLTPITLYISTSTGSNGTAASAPQVITPLNIPLYENTTATGSNLIGYDIFLRGASSLGWSSATLYSVMFMEAAIAFGFAATIGTGTLFFGALAGMGLLTLGAATGLLAWWIPLILGLLTVMAITVFKEL